MLSSSFPIFSSFLPSPLFLSSPFLIFSLSLLSFLSSALTELLPGIFNQLGSDSLTQLRKLAQSYPATTQDAGDVADVDDDEVPSKPMPLYYMWREIGWRMKVLDNSLQNSWVSIALFCLSLKLHKWKHLSSPHLNAPGRMVCLMDYTLLVRNILESIIGSVLVKLPWI